MSKKKRKNKKARKPRSIRQRRSLRGKQKNIKTKPQKIKDSVAPVVVDVRSDLRKTAILTAVCLGILLVLFLTQSRWSAIFL